MDMLNQAGYREAPVCERKILPDFPKFKAVEWAEITDKEEIKKIRKEQIIMEFLWPTEGQKKAKKFWLAEERKMDSGDYPILHRAHIDIDHDGEVETVYRFSVLKPELEKYGNCTTLKTYFIKHDDAKKNEEVYGRPLGVANTLNSRSGLSRLFYYDSRVRMDSWSQTYRYQLTVADIEPGPGSHACGVNIVQHGEADK
ncbi:MULTISPECIES: hypothetical protein [unclassified Microbulbifer]|uniref:hypothetical protein n=1 Tax=unclassified Microbulbifer TaxID=2619833 RepID=UPI0027E58873|nr:MULTISPECIES: hypothetical protein [unclassified Microbulbifer]